MVRALACLWYAHELRATRHRVDACAGVLRGVRFDQIQASLALSLETSFGNPFCLPYLVDDPTDAPEHGLVVALDHEAQRHDVELLVIESAEGNAYHLGEQGQRLTDARRHALTARTQPPWQRFQMSRGFIRQPSLAPCQPMLWADSDVKAGIYDRGAKG